MQGGGIRGVQLGKYKMKSGSHQTPRLSTHRNTPKNQLRAQVQHECNCCNIQYVMVGELEWKQSSDPQLTLLHFSVSFLPMTAAQELPQELRGVCKSASTLPIWILQIYHKNKQPGSLRKSSLPCPEQSSDPAP